MGIASWKGPIRKYKDSPTTMREKDAIPTINSYIDSFLSGKIDQSTALTSLQATLDIYIGRSNFRVLINVALTEIAKDKLNRDLILKNLIQECKNVSKK